MKKRILGRVIVICIFGCFFLIAYAATCEEKLIEDNKKCKAMADGLAKTACYKNAQNAYQKCLLEE